VQFLNLNLYLRKKIMTLAKEKVSARTKTGTTNPQIQTLKTIIEQDNDYRQDSLDLTASENYTSTLVRSASTLISGAFYHFIGMYPAAPGEWFFPDSKAWLQITESLRDLGKKLFHSATFDERPNGGSITEMAVVLAACKQGDAYIHFAPEDGGHFGSQAIAQKVGIQEYYLPYNAETQQIDLDRLAGLLKQHPNIKLVMLDQSHKLRFQPLKDIRQVIDNIPLVYDCSHDAGLIIGGQIPQPLLKGADILIGNTHKTLPGPNKAFMAFADADHPLFKPVSDWICPLLQSNCHAEQNLPLLMALLEMETFGQDYAKQTITNSQLLAKSLAAKGFEVVGKDFDYTETQQIHVVLNDQLEALNVVKNILPLVGIRANNIQLPGYSDRFGLRLGTQAITRRGLKEAEIEYIADLFARLLIKGEKPRHIKQEVHSFLRNFPLSSLDYCFNSLEIEPIKQALLKGIA
jgi:glycine hydroxymethyltransferase